MTTTARPDDPYFAALARWALRGIWLVLPFGRLRLALLLLRLWALCRDIRAGRRPPPLVSNLRAMEDTLRPLDAVFDRGARTSAEQDRELDLVEQAVTEILKAH